MRGCSGACKAVPGKLRGIPLVEVFLEIESEAEGEGLGYRIGGARLHR